MKHTLRLLSVVMSVLWAQPIYASYSACVGTIKQAGADHTQVTSDAFDTSGTDTVWLSASDVTQGTPSAAWVTDSKSNSSWALLSGASAVGTTNTRARLYVCKACTTGSGHTFTYNTSGSQVYPTITVLACAGGHATALTDQENGATTALASSLSTGSITPSEDNEIVITGISSLDTGTMTVPSGYTIVAQAPLVVGTAIAGGMAYKIQTTATATNPSWSLSVAAEGSANVGSFKAAAGGGGGSSTPGRCLALLGVGCDDESERDVAIPGTAAGTPTNQERSAPFDRQPFAAARMTRREETGQPSRTHWPSIPGGLLRRSEAVSAFNGQVRDHTSERLSPAVLSTQRLLFGVPAEACSRVNPWIS